MMDCTKCDKGGVYNTTVPFVVHENLRAQMSAANARLIRVIVLLIVLFVASNGMWLWHESQFSDEYYEITQENEDGYNNFIGHDGDITNGKADDKSEEADP